MEYESVSRNASEYSAPDVPEPKLMFCYQQLEHEGGAHWCTLPLGHAGPHEPQPALMPRHRAPPKRLSEAPDLEFGAAKKRQARSAGEGEGDGLADSDEGRLLELDDATVDVKLWAGAAARGWRVTEARKGSSAGGMWRYIAPGGRGFKSRAQAAQHNSQHSTRTAKREKAASAGAGAANEPSGHLSLAQLVQRRQLVDAATHAQYQTKLPGQMREAGWEVLNKALTSLDSGHFFYVYGAPSDAAIAAGGVDERTRWPYHTSFPAAVAWFRQQEANAVVVQAQAVSSGDDLDEAEAATPAAGSATEGSPEVTRGGGVAATAWSNAEDLALAEAVQRLGCRWLEVAKLLPGRTPRKPPRAEPSPVHLLNPLLAPLRAHPRR